MTEQERFLTVGELLDRWNVDARTLDKLIDCAGLSYVEFPLPRVRRFPLSVVITFEQQHLRTSTAA